MLKFILQALFQSTRHIYEKKKDPDPQLCKFTTFGFMQLKGFFYEILLVHKYLVSDSDCKPYKIIVQKVVAGTL